MNIVKKQNGLVDLSNQQVIDIIKSQVAKGATDEELQYFLALASKYNLDPLLKQIWFIKYNNQTQIFTSRDGYLSIAHESGMFDGMESYTIDDEHGNPIKGVCIVYRKDMKHPFKAEVKIKEYFKKGREGKPSVWETHPSAMIIKVAEVFALKRAFQISGLITYEEMSDVSDNPTIQDAEILPTKEQLDEIKLMFDSNAHLLTDKELQYPNNLKSYEKAASCLQWIKNVAVERNQPTVIETQVTVTSNLEDLI